ncbi:MAG: A/G-specific adenine glycosylase [Thermoleophilia bacterium]|nr:A/G-specific adenine glycosylase [Thermoleophilia bacterium]
MDRDPGACPLPAGSPEAFRRTVLEHYRDHGRDLPWRRTRDPYAILVSEVMLQQTRVSRVIPKYEEFLAAFPTVLDLAGAALADVLGVWQGLGYNRRALALQRAARSIATDHRGVVPGSPAALRALPGIGPATAAAVCVFAYHQPLVFIETNIRSAYIHFFFRECVSVPDHAILPLIELTLDRERPRDWYYALMDYGAYIKRNHPNPSRRSRHHTVQTPFEGSHRQLRAEILRLLLAAAPEALTPAEMEARFLPLTTAEPEIAAILDELAAEGFLVRGGGGYSVA